MPNTTAETDKRERTARAFTLAGLMLVPVLILFVHLLLVYRA